MQKVFGGVTPDSEAKLIQAARLGDRNAYSRLVELNQSRLRAFLRNLSNQDRDLADDLAQETFMIDYREITNFREEGPFLSWLMGIGYRHFLQYARKRKRRRELLEGRGVTETATSPRPITLGIELEDALSRLSLPEKTAILLSSREGLSHTEIASIMELPLGTVKSHIARGRNKLKRILSGLEY